MNKIYSVLRIDNWDKVQSVYEGRIRDCKKSLKTIAEEYKKRGWVVKIYDYTLIIKSDSPNEKQYIYLIHEPEYQYEKQDNSSDCRQGDGSHQINRNRDNCLT